MMAMPISVKNYGDTNFITGIRAFAAMGVVVIHSGGAGLRALGGWGTHLADLGRTGPYVFFVVSGYSVAVSYAQSNGFAEYFARRIWRIVPLYYFWLGFAFIFCNGWSYWQHFYKVPLDGYNILMHGTFLSVLDYRIANSFFDIEWSIPVEVCWYLLLPCLMALIPRKRSAIMALPICLIAYVAMMKAAGVLVGSSDDAMNAIHWSPLPYFLSYAAGVSAYRLRSVIPRPAWAGDAAVLIAVAAILLYAAGPVTANAVIFDDYVLMTLIAFSLLLFGSSKSTFCNRVLANKIVLYVGTISYGLYLCHMFVVNLFQRESFSFLRNSMLSFLVVSSLSIAIASCTYALIERPGLALSKRLQRRFFAAGDVSSLSPGRSSASTQP